MKASPHTGRRTIGSLLACIPALIFPLTAAPSLENPDPSLHEPAVWKGKNGASIRAFFQTENQGVIHVVDANTGKPYQLKRETLSPETLEWYLRAKERAEKGTATAAPATTPSGAEAPAGFIPPDAANLDRTKIPTLSQSEYGHKASDCVPNAYAMFFMWWDEHTPLKIPRGRDFDDKAEWIHKELSRNFGTGNNRGTYYSDVDKGLVELFTKRFAESATFHARRDYDIRPATLAPLVTGANATVLCLSLFHDDDYDGGHAVSVLKLTTDGAIEFNTWGQKFSGKIVSLGPLDDDERPAVETAPKERFEIKLDSPDSSPQWMKDKNLRFVIDPTRWDNLHVVTPFVKKQG
jgi:hypothetical protein